MSLWSKEEAEAYFESGGEVEPIAAGRGGVQPKVSGPPVVVSWFSGGMTPEQGRSQLKSWSAAVKAAGLTDHIVVDPPTERVPPPANLSEYLTSLVSEIDDEPSRLGRPILLFGHSHGALWAYALAAHLGERACRLVVAARRPPSAPVLDVWGVASAAEFAALSDETVLRSMVTAWPNRMLEQIVPFPASEVRCLHPCAGTRLLPATARSRPCCASSQPTPMLLDSRRGRSGPHGRPPSCGLYAASMATVRCALLWRALRRLACGAGRLHAAVRSQPAPSPCSSPLQPVSRSLLLSRMACVACVAWNRSASARRIGTAAPHRGCLRCDATCSPSRPPTRSQVARPRSA